MQIPARTPQHPEGCYVWLPRKWQAGYPQSGNTWLIFLIAGLLGRVPQSWDDAPLLMPNWDAVATSERGAPLGWIRCHAKYLPDVMGDTPLEVLYVARHPFDVMLSAYRYRKKFDAYNGTKEAYINWFIKHGGDMGYEHDLKTGTWNENVRSWLSLERAVVIRYEDLKRDARTTLVMALEHCSLPRNNLDQAIEGAQRERMAKLDTQQFIGAGKAGQWKEELTEVHIKAGKAAFAEGMELLGYSV